MKTNEPKPMVSREEMPSEAGTGSFPIVGIGASAGGLEAIEQFLEHVPKDSGMAYVIVQHLDPTHKGMLPELLQRISNMEVLQVQDGMVVKANMVYVIPPNASMSVVQGVLHLFAPVEARGLRLPIDFFLCSLAEDRQERSIGVILSGMGSDGNIGLLAIKEKGGMVLVQDPATAKFDSMPSTAIKAVHVDIVAPANELPEKLMELVQHIAFQRNDRAIENTEHSDPDNIMMLLRTHTGNDFSLYKKTTIDRRVERRMAIHKMDKLASYVGFLRDNPKEVDILFKELMIGVTGFFRDAAVWEYLKEKVLPAVIARRPPGSILRAWVPACSTGEEAYTLAMVFREALEKVIRREGYSMQIFATDLDQEAIEIARKGIFSANAAKDVSPDRLARFFTKTEGGFRVSAEIREMVVFATHNVIMHPPFTKLDFLSCRNLLIYMDNELQKKLFGLFHYSLNAGGILVLGSAESLGSQSHLFAAVDGKLKIYLPSVRNIKLESFDFPASYSLSKSIHQEKKIHIKATDNIQLFADQLLLQQFAPAGVLVNELGDIIYISGHTGKYLEPAVGKANMNIFAMLRNGLRHEFPVAFRKAIQKKETVILRNIKVGTNGGTQITDVTIRWIDKPEVLSGSVMIVFTDVKEHSNTVLPAMIQEDVPGSAWHTELESELQRTREALQNTQEEMQTSQEELKSTNEELQSTNEELQSSNEELTTSKEEMQSLNEELQTVNAELMSKVEDYSRVNSDMKNLLNSTDIATLFLDRELRIRRFTNQATKIFKLIQSDVGRPFTDLVSDLMYPELAADATEVLRTLVFIQKLIPTHDGRWFSIRIIPYRTVDDRIEGLVITFVNITDLKLLEIKLHETTQMLRLLLNSSSDAIVGLSPDWKILEFNREAEKFFDKKREEVVNRNYFEMFIPSGAQKSAEADMNKVLNGALPGRFEMPVIAAKGNNIIVGWSANILYDNRGLSPGMIILTKKEQPHD